MKVNLREIIHYIDESTLEKAKNEKVQKQESPSKMSKDVEESVDKMISNRMSKPINPYFSSNAKSGFSSKVKAPLSRICQMYPKTIPPIRFGIKKMVRKRLDAFNLLVSASASANAPTLISIVTTIVNNAVNQNACKKVASVSAYL